MIYQVVTRYLRDNIEPTHFSHWSDHNPMFFSSLYEEIAETELEEYKYEIKRAFVDHFEKIGRVVVLFKNSREIVLKLLLHPKTPSHDKEFIALLQNHIDMVIKEDNILKIPLELMNIFDAKSQETLDTPTVRDSIKNAIKTVFELDEKDAIIYMRTQCVVKKFVDKNVEEGRSARFNGLDEELLHDEYKKLTQHNAVPGILRSGCDTLCQNQLNVSKINNNFFDKNFLSFSKLAIAGELSKFLKKPDDFIIGFAGYVLRLNFIEMHKQYAFYLLEQIARSNQSAKDFLAHYTGSIVLEGGKKYLLPAIEDKDGRRWNILTITVIATTWFKNKNEQESAKKQLATMEPQYLNLKKEVDTMQNRITLLENSVFTAKNKIISDKKNVNEYIFQINTARQEKAKEDVLKQLEQRKNQALERIKTNSDVVSRDESVLVRTKADSMNTQKVFDKLDKDRKELLKQERYYAKMVENNDASFDSVWTSVTVTLTKRKQPQPN